MRRKTWPVLSPLLDELLWRMVRRRWEMAGGAPRSATVVMDSTVVVRYGLKQAGAEKGYNPKKPGRPSHHPPCWPTSWIRATASACAGCGFRRMPITPE